MKITPSIVRISVRRVAKTRTTDQLASGEFLHALGRELLGHNQLSAHVAVETSDDPLVGELVTICKDFSKDRAIGPDENLFETGVSSLTLTEIMLAVDEKYPGQVDINDLFDYPTIRELAGFIRGSLDKN